VERVVSLPCFLLRRKVGKKEKKKKEEEREEGMGEEESHTCHRVCCDTACTANAADRHQQCRDLLCVTCDSFLHMFGSGDHKPNEDGTHSCLGILKYLRLVAAKP